MEVGGVVIVQTYYKNLMVEKEIHVFMLNQDKYYLNFFFKQKGYVKG